jgi:hypothetical protein
MKTYTVCVPVDYLQGHLRYGHFEYSIEANSEEEAIKKLKTIKETIKKMDNGEIPNDPNFMDIDYDNIVVDDYCIDGCGDKLFDEAYIEK